MRRPITQPSACFSLLPITRNEYSINNLEIKIYNYARQCQHSGLGKRPKHRKIFRPDYNTIKWDRPRHHPWSREREKSERNFILSHPHQITHRPSLIVSISHLATSPPNVSRTKLHVHHEVVTESVWYPKGTLLLVQIRVSRIHGSTMSMGSTPSHA